MATLSKWRIWVKERGKPDPKPEVFIGTDQKPYLHCDDLVVETIDKQDVFEVAKSKINPN